MVSVGDEYAFNMSQAGAACQFLNTTIATKEQVEKALQHGLETCKFGWIHEQIVVIPRIKRIANCGQNKTGVLPWTVPGYRIFNAFCFKSEAEYLDTSTPSDIPEKMSTTVSTLTATLASTTVSLPVTSTPQLPVHTNSTIQVSKLPFTAPTTSPTSGNIFTFQSLSSITSTLPHPHFHLTSTGSLPLPASLTGSTPSTVSSSISSLLVSSTTQTEMPVFSQTMSSTKSSSAAIPTAFISLAIILLLLAAAAAVWYYKRNKPSFPFWPRRRLRDDTETEMWRNTESETDQQDQQREEGGDTNRKHSCDIAIQMNPETKVNFLSN